MAGKPSTLVRNIRETISDTRSKASATSEKVSNTTGRTSDAVSSKTEAVRESVADRVEPVREEATATRHELGELRNEVAAVGATAKQAGRRVQSGVDHTQQKARRVGDHLERATEAVEYADQQFNQLESDWDDTPFSGGQSRSDPGLFGGQQHGQSGASFDSDGHSSQGAWTGYGGRDDGFGMNSTRGSAEPWQNAGMGGSPWMESGGEFGFTPASGRGETPDARYFGPY